MTSLSYPLSNRLKEHRTGELAIQDEFQRGLEEGLANGGLDQNVLLWNDTHNPLRFDPITKKNRASVVMNSVRATSDSSFNPKSTRNVKPNILGLVDAIQMVCGGPFQKWIDAHPHITITVRELCEIAASHLANLFENVQHGERTPLWRLLLALGERQAWDKHGASFGCNGDPRFLDAKDIPGATGKVARLYYRSCFTNSESPQPFMDVEPRWLPTEMGSLANAARGEMTQHIKRISDGIDPRNAHAWIREFPMGIQQIEYADFALLINGLPIIIVEIKTPDAGLKEAVRDFHKKPTYQGAAIAMVSDGAHAILSSSMTGKLEGWVHYENNMGDRQTVLPEDPRNSCAYLTRQLLSRPERLEFLIVHCGAINENGHYQVGRAQQYQALASWAQDLVWTQACNRALKVRKKPLIKIGNRLVRHTQRTGKTHTMVRAIHLAIGLYPDLYRLSIVMVGEVLILGQIHEELTRNNTGLADRSLVVHRVESRQQLSKVLKQERSEDQYSTGRIVLLNMQKISARTTDTTALPDSQKTLVVVDEGHLAQTGLTADVRDMIFPEASHFLLTATPKDSMSQRYGITEDYHVLDDFGYGIAQQAGIVCVTVFKRTSYSFTDDPHKIAALAGAIKQVLGDDAKDQDIMAALDHVFNSTLEDSDEENEAISSHIRALIQIIRRKIEQDVIEERLDAVVCELSTYRDSLEKDENGNAIFRPRALLFARDTESAMDFIRFIQAQNPDQASQDQRNVYRGFRFAIDVSDFGKDPSGQPRTFSHFNPGISDEGALKRRLKVMDDSAVDVLIAVGKYTKGYDNDQLAVVAIARNVGETSLINQIYTRPATMRPGKPKGVCLDLSLGLGNVACWNESMRLYDRKFDREQLYTEARIFETVNQVEQKLTKTASTIGLKLSDLEDYSQVVAAFEDMTADERKILGRNFILHARETANLIAKMPDSSIYGDIRKPLIGLKISLSKIQAFYPELVESRDMDESGILNGGYTHESLGQTLRNVLSILKESSLKALFDIRMGDAIEIIPTRRDDALLKARDRQFNHAWQAAIEGITGQGGDSPDEHDAHPDTRGPRSDTVLIEGLNRILDKLRDEINTAPGNPVNLAPLILEAEHAVSQWLDAAHANGGELKTLIQKNLQVLIEMRGRRLGMDFQTLGLSNALGHLIDEAARHMADDFEAWHKGLSPEWTDRPAKRLVQEWLKKYVKKNMTDFLAPTDSRQDLHGMLPGEWTAQLIQMHDPKQLRELLGQDRSEETFKGIAPVIERSMEIALETRAAIANAMVWHQKSQNEREEALC